jgi:hypothetical protein
MKQSAVEWLEKKLWKKIQTTEEMIIFQQAKEKENEQKGYSEEEVLKAQQAILCNIKDALMNENYIIEYLNNLKTNKI